MAVRGFTINIGRTFSILTGFLKKKWFEYYCTHYNTLELNTTFYRFPRLHFLEGWHNSSPAVFQFSVKAPRLITHFKKFTGVESYMNDLYAVVTEGLKKKRGCVLFQLPPRLGYRDDRLDKILDCLDPAFDNVLEFREPSWWTPEVFSKLSKRKVIFCGMSYPGFPDAYVKEYKTMYYRFHGIEDLYKSKYERTFLEAFTDDVNNEKKIKTAYIYFNNDIGGSAIANANELKSYAALLR